MPPSRRRTHAVRPDGAHAVLVDRLDVVAGESDGTRRLLTLAPWLLDPDSALVVEDELERSLHPNLTRMLVSRFLADGSSRQVVFTTHDTNLLGALPRDSVHFVHKDGSGASRLHSLRDFPETELDQLGTAIEAAYLVGRFGGVPDLHEPNAAPLQGVRALRLGSDGERALVSLELPGPSGTLSVLADEDGMLLDAVYDDCDLERLATPGPGGWGFALLDANGGASGFVTTAPGQRSLFEVAEVPPGAVTLAALGPTRWLWARDRALVSLPVTGGPELAFAGEVDEAVSVRGLAATHAKRFLVWAGGPEKPDSVLLSDGEQLLTPFLYPLPGEAVRSPVDATSHLAWLTLGAGPSGPAATLWASPFALDAAALAPVAVTWLAPDARALAGRGGYLAVVESEAIVSVFPLGGGIPASHPLPPTEFGPTGLGIGSEHVLVGLGAAEGDQLARVALE